MAKPTKHYDKWRIRWIDEHGNRQSAVYDSNKEASHQLKLRQVHVEEIKRGLRQAPIEKRTFSDACDYWLEHRAVTKRSQGDDISIIRCHLRPAFGHLMLVQVTCETVDQFRQSLSHLSPKTLHNILTLLISILNQAKKLKWLRDTPEIRKPKIQLIDSQFAYLRDRAAVQRFLNCSRSHGEQTFVLYSTAIFAGLRKGELAGLKWSDIDFEKRIIVVQRSYSGPTKSGRPRFVPITTALFDTLKNWRTKQFGDLVFQNAVGKMLHSNCNFFTSFFKDSLVQAGQTEIVDDKVVPALVFHDLRHTFASHWVLNNGDIFKLQKIMGHESIQMTMRYAHLAPDAFAGDLDRFNQYMTNFSEASPVKLKCR